MEKQDVTWQPMELHGGAEIHLHPVEEEVVTPWGRVLAGEMWSHGDRSPCWSRFAAEFVILRGLSMEQPDPEGLQLLEGPRMEQSGKNCSPREEPMLEKFMCPMGSTQQWSREECEESST